MRRFTQNINLLVSSYTKIMNFEVFQAIRSYLLKIYMGHQSSSFRLEDLFS